MPKKGGFADRKVTRKKVKKRGGSCAYKNHIGMYRM